MKMIKCTLIILISMISSIYGFSFSHSIIQDIHNKSYVCYAADEIVDANIEVQPNFHVSRDICECRHTYCRCCETDIEEICIVVQYFEVFHVPAAFGLEVSYNGKIILDLVVNATNLPCVHLPFINNFMDICLQLYNIKDHKDKVSVCMKLKGHFIFSKWQIPVGCVNIPKVPSNDHGNIVTLDENIAGGNLLQKLEYKTERQLNDTNSTSLTMSSTSRVVLNTYIILAIFGRLFFSLQ